MVQPGRVTGFLGPNGAGKSTTMRLILGLDAPTRGSATVNGKPYRRQVAPLGEVGALPGDQPERSFVRLWPAKMDSLLLLASLWRSLCQPNANASLSAPSP